MRNLSIVTIFFLLSTFSCKDTPVPESPEIIVSYLVENQDVTLSGQILFKNDSPASAKVDWGDGNYSEIELLSENIFEIPHHYSKSGNFSASVSAENISGLSNTKTISFTVTYPEISMNGILPELYKTSKDEILILSLNLHTYQETEAIRKLNLVADLIGLLDVDFIAFQECAQHKNSENVGGILRADNMAKLIADTLSRKYGKSYAYAWDWAHYGWDVWEEGLAVMSKYPMQNSEAQYISTSHSNTDIESRKAVFGAFDVPDFGRLHLFSTHTHWRTSETSQAQNLQIETLKNFAAQKESLSQTPVKLTIISGDFNCNPTDAAPWNEGYLRMTSEGEYEDAFLSANPEANTLPAQSRYFTIGGTFPGRIDYIFLKKNDLYAVESSQIIFTSTIIGSVSDHFGVLTKLKLLQ